MSAYLEWLLNATKMKKKNKKVTNKYSLKSLMLNNTALGTTKDELIKG